MNLLSEKTGKYISSSIKILRLWLSIVPLVGISTTSDAGTISGIVLNGDESEGVSVYLCDGKTGMPLSGESFRPVHWTVSQNKDLADDLIIRKTDATGRFSFGDVPEGNFRLVAQTWIKDKASFEHAGAVISLMGTAQDIHVTSPDHDVKPRIALCPPPGSLCRFDLNLDHDEALIFFSTSQPEFDAVLGLHAPGDAFWKNITGFNKMPRGTTISWNAGSNAMLSFAFIMTQGDPEGFACMSGSHFNVSGIQSTVVGPGANHKKSPPDELNELSQFLDKHKLRTEDMLELPPAPANEDSKDEYDLRMEALLNDLRRVIPLPDGRRARVGDLLALQKYKEFPKDTESAPVKNRLPDPGSRIFLNNK